MENRMMIIEEVALELRRCTKTITGYANDGDLPRYKEQIDGRWRTVFAASDVEKLKIKKGL